MDGHIARKEMNFKDIKEALAVMHWVKLGLGQIRGVWKLHENMVVKYN